MRVRVLLAAAIALVAVAVAVTLSSRGAEMTGTNGVNPLAMHVVVPPGAQFCQDGTQLPRDSGRLRLVGGSGGETTPPLAARFTAVDGSVVASGRSSGGSAGAVVIPLSEQVTADRPTRMCVRNLGSEAVAFGGDIADPQRAARVRGEPTPGLVAATFLLPSVTSWWDVVPDVAHRFGLGKAPVFGTWTLPVAVLLLAGAWVAAIRLLLRESPR